MKPMPASFFVVGRSASSDAGRHLHRAYGSPIWMLEISVSRLLTVDVSEAICAVVSGSAVDPGCACSAAIWARCWRIRA